MERQLVLDLDPLAGRAGRQARAAEARDQRERRPKSSSTSFLSWGSRGSSCSILPQELIAVEWSRWKRSPISGKEALVKVRARYIATCRAWTYCFWRRGAVGGGVGGGG